MTEYVYLIGLDEPESTLLREKLEVPCVANPILPKFTVKDGEAWMESPRGGRMLPVSKVIYHGIFEDDLDFMVGLALWGGPCLPNPRAMLDCRLKLPCLVRALEHTRFGLPQRSFASPYAYFDSDTERVAKWGNWHCGENKERFTGSWSSENPAVIEHFLEGEAVRVVIIGDQYWQIHLRGDDWLKSIHHSTADFMDVDPELLEDTRHLQQAFGLEIVANDYIVTHEGTKHLLEVNHIPNVTRFPEIWEAYANFVTEWVHQN
jgi:hypothetical protein